MVLVARLLHLSAGLMPLATLARGNELGSLVGLLKKSGPYTPKLIHSNDLLEVSLGYICVVDPKVKLILSRSSVATSYSLSATNSSSADSFSSSLLRLFDYLFGGVGFLGFGVPNSVAL